MLEPKNIADLVAYVLKQPDNVDIAEVVIRRHHHVEYYPGAEEMKLKLVYEPGTRRVLGAQAVGGGVAPRRRGPGPRARGGG